MNLSFFFAFGISPNADILSDDHSYTAVQN